MFLKTTRRQLLEFTFKRGLGVAALAQLPFIQNLAAEIDRTTAKDNRTLNILTYINHNNHNRFLTSFYGDFSSLIHDLTKGGLKINFLTLSEAGLVATDVKNPFLLKDIDGFHLASSFLNTIIPGSSLFTEVSELNEDPNNKSHIAPEFLAEWQKVLSTHNLTWHPFGFAESCGLWSKKPIGSLADLQALKIRTHGIALEAITELGGKATYGQFTRRVDSFKSEEYDAMEGLMPYFDYSMGFPEIAKNYYQGSWPRRNTQMGIFLKKENLANVPSSMQNLLAGAFTSYNDQSVRKTQLTNLLGKSALKMSGVKIQSLPVEVEKALTEKKILALKAELNKTAQTKTLSQLLEKRLLFNAKSATA